MREKIEIHIRRARPEEAEALTALIRRSKAHWGYDEALLEIWRPQLTLRAETIARDPVYCAEDARTGTLAGVSHWYALNDEEVYLDDLFVEPAYIGTGVGARLWRHAVERATAQDAREFVLDAEPNAQPFYEHMGAVVTGWQDSPDVPGRRLPRMRYDLPQRREI